MEEDKLIKGMLGVSVAMIGVGFISQMFSSTPIGLEAWVVGRVLDASTQQPIPTAIVGNTQVNADGTFTLHVVGASGNAVNFTVSATDYISQEFIVGGVYVGQTKDVGDILLVHASYTCPVCNRSFATEAEYNAHWLKAPPLAGGLGDLDGDGWFTEQYDFAKIKDNWLGTVQLTSTEYTLALFPGYTTNSMYNVLAWWNHLLYP